MICKNCGRELREDAKFCGICGMSVEKEESTAEASPEQTAFEQAAPEQMSPEQVSPEQVSPEQVSPEQTMNTEKRAEPLKFGVGIVAFCAVVIFLLSVTCGVFAGLFFSERGKNVAARPSCAIVSEISQW